MRNVAVAAALGLALAAGPAVAGQPSPGAFHGTAGESHVSLAVTYATGALHCDFFPADGSTWPGACGATPGGPSFVAELTYTRTGTAFTGTVTTDTASGGILVAHLDGTWIETSLTTAQLAGVARVGRA